jgi:hypothetical protein
MTNRNYNMSNKLNKQQKRVQQTNQLSELSTSRSSFDNSLSHFQSLESEGGSVTPKTSAPSLQKKNSSVQSTRRTNKGNLIARREYGTKGQDDHLAFLQMYSGESLGIDLEMEISASATVQTELIEIEVHSDRQNIWDLCIALSAAAIQRKGQNNLWTTLPNGNDIGTAYLAALALYLSIYRCSQDGASTINMTIVRLVKLLTMCQSCIKNGRYYKVTWHTNDILADMQTLPMHAFANQLISVAPWTGALDFYGRQVLSNTIPVFSLEDIDFAGNSAHQEMLAWLLPRERFTELVPFTSHTTINKNPALLGCYRDADPSPLAGFRHYITENLCKQRDYALAAVGMFRPASDRESFNVRTIQKGTKAACYWIMYGDEVPIIPQTHYLDIALLFSNWVTYMIGADINSDPQWDLKTLDGTVTYLSDFLGEATAGKLLTAFVAAISATFGVGNCFSAGDVMVDSGGMTRVAFGGSRFLVGTEQYSQIFPQAFSEAVAALKNCVNLDDGKIYYITITTRGSVLTVDMDDPGGRNLAWFVWRMFPETIGTLTNYDLATPSGTDIPDELNLLDLVCFTWGGPAVEARNTVTAIATALSNNTTMAFSAGDDGIVRRHLYNTHIIEPQDLVQNFNTTPTYIISGTVTTTEVLPQDYAMMLNMIFPVAFITFGALSPYQSCFKREFWLPNEPMDYAAYRAPVCLASCHKLGANANAPFETDIANTHRTAWGEGGAVMDYIFRDGNWVSWAEMLAEGLGSLVSPELGKAAGKFVGKGARAIHDAVFRGELSPRHLAPFSHGVSYNSVMSRLNDTKKKVNRYGGKRRGKNSTGKK